MSVIARTLLLAVVVVLAACVAGLAWTIWEYQHLAADVNHAHTRLPSVVSSALTDAGVTRDTPNVTLVRGYGGLAEGSTMLFRSDPDHSKFSFLTIPAYVSKLPPSKSARVDGPAVARLTRWVQQTGGIPVNHVALLNFAGIRGIVDALGGITVVNRTSFDVEAGSHAVHFPAGSVHLDGAQTVSFLSVKPDTAAHHELAEVNEAAVLQGVIDTAVRSHDVTSLLTTATRVADASATDLTASDVIGLVAVRLHATSVVNCSLAHAGPTLLTAKARSAIAVFSAKAKRSPICHARAATTVPSAAILGASAAALSDHGVSVLVVALLVMVAMLIVSTIILLARRRVVRVGEPVGSAHGAGQGTAAVKRSDGSWRGRLQLRRRRPARSHVQGGRVMIGGQAGGGLGFGRRAGAPAPPIVAPDQDRSDRADLVVRLRREGLSYREIADRLTAAGDPVTSEAARRIWSRASGTQR
jgi:anionic cell wall polymer biosynthesis LytR-Cps2A-Psr (LCP) family protein